MSEFSFVENETLRGNLDKVFNHIVDLTTLTTSEEYKDKDELVSSLRKTIIIHTACIIEALLLNELKKKDDIDRVEVPEDWTYVDIKVLHTVNNSEEVIAGRRKLNETRLQRLDFLKIIRVCLKEKIINQKLFDDCDKVRKLRNRLHISGLQEADKIYSIGEVDFCFGVLNDIKKSVN